MENEATQFFWLFFELHIFGKFGTEKNGRRILSFLRVLFFFFISQLMLWLRVRTFAFFGEKGKLDKFFFLSLALSKSLCCALRFLLPNPIKIYDGPQFPRDFYEGMKREKKAKFKNLYHKIYEHVW